MMHAALILLAMAATPRAAAEAPDVAVVVAPRLRAALEPWVHYRRGQGHQVAMVAGNRSVPEIRGDLQALSQGGRLRHVLLVGDADPAMYSDPEVLARCVPTGYAEAKVNVLWGSEPHIATDNFYADLNGDGVPDLAVGRFPANSPEELQRMIAKTLAYERSANYGVWRRQVNVIAGVGGFGWLADSVLESAARYFLTQKVPAEYAVSITHASWRSPFSPDPRQFHQTTLRRLNEGSLFWVYIGHGYPYGLDRVQTPGGTFHILANDDTEKLAGAHAPPIALFLACYTGAIDAWEDCLAERMLAQVGGPVAIVAGSRVTMPYGMTVLSSGLIDECFHRQTATLGEALLAAKQRMMADPDPADAHRATIDAVASAISPSPNQLADERAEHVLLMNLLGDPLLRLRFPKPVELQVSGLVQAGDRLRVEGVSPVDGEGEVELVVARGRLAFPTPARRTFPETPEGLSQLQQTYERANDGRLTVVPLTIPAGRFSVELPVPLEAAGACHVRVYVAGNKDFAAGASEVTVTPAREARRPPDAAAR
ncbi:MAG: C25 family cysteine peptidase [Patescibacteria group bacterium]|nr:C25 family cysteine peptidase [Patescibacteria group bacterium]